jgi:hypothetical protein
VTHEPFSLRRFPAVMLEVYRREGMRALWRGHMAQMLRVAPYSGIQFMVYDFIKKYFERFVAMFLLYISISSIMISGILKCVLQEPAG